MFNLFKKEEPVFVRDETEIISSYLKDRYNESVKVLRELDERITKAEYVKLTKKGKDELKENKKLFVKAYDIATNYTVCINNLIYAGCESDAYMLYVNLAGEFLEKANIYTKELYNE